MKVLMASLVLMGTIIAAHATTLFGSDDFNDNSMDTNNWTVFNLDDGSELSETNNRLELVSSAATAWDALTWAGSTCSYTQDWSFTYDMVDHFIPTNMVNSRTYIGMFSLFGSEDNSFGIELAKGNDTGPFSEIHANIKSGGAFLADLKPEFPGDALRVRIDFDAQTKAITISYYDEGFGFVPLTSESISGWGMTDSDTFDFYIYEECDNTAVTNGQIYGDNFAIWDPTPSSPNLAISNGAGNVALNFQTDTGLYYELWAKNSLSDSMWSGPLQTVSVSNDMQTVEVSTATNSVRFFQVRGFESAPELAAFTNQVVGTTLPTTLTNSLIHIDSATRFTNNGSETGDWSYTKIGANTGWLVFTYDASTNNPDYYREELDLLYTGKDAGNYRYSKIYNGDYEDPSSVEYGPFTF